MRGAVDSLAWMMNDSILAIRRGRPRGVGARRGEVRR
jgi:hypothetical protein